MSGAPVLDSFALFNAASLVNWISPATMVAFLVLAPLSVAGLIQLLPTNAAARLATAAILLTLGIVAGSFPHRSGELDEHALPTWSFPAGTSTAPNHVGLVWTARPELTLVHGFLIVLTVASIWSCSRANRTRHFCTQMLGLLSMSLLVCVADDVTSLLTGLAGVILILWWQIQSASSASAENFLRWHLGGWISLLLGLAGLIGGMSLVRAAPHSAPSVTGFLLSGDLLQIPRVCLQHPAALAVWEQWRGYALLPLLAACLIMSGTFPCSVWARRLPAELPLVTRLWIACVLTKMPLLLLCMVIAPVYAGSPELLTLWIGVPALLGLLLTAAGFVSAPVTHVRFQAWPILWGNQMAVWLLIQCGTTRSVAAMLFGLMGAASMLWILGSQTNPLASQSRVTAKRLSLWIAALVFCGIPVLAWPFSIYDRVLTPLHTGTAFDSLAPLGVAFATLVMTVRLIQALAETSDEYSEPGATLETAGRS